MNENNPINPNYYCGGDRGSKSFDVIDIIDAFKLDFYQGNAIKYIIRAGCKPGQLMSQDIRKAIWYLDRYALAIELNEKEGIV